LGVFSPRGGGAFFQGVFEKTGGSVMVFCGEVVVNCWWERGVWMVHSERWKNITF
jgi:hypothetical protein